MILQLIVLFISDDHFWPFFISQVRFIDIIIFAFMLMLPAKPYNCVMQLLSKN